ncbi:purine and uridine phosphorylase [Aspergillus sclerotiicarbonarius CBS 121057]|uniref:Purine and uridine phosphorylase n=1 Tax=Aspergillus sclerotiicarbonarius (strain CBS 121057 / IBT 28362) TaxID=1448318 RepID=A0A319F6Z5_ASPSB|nr:purine and uridine phosphorylase [Aspergillus sclerotiicarbonarius CBS 121057]
MNVFHRRLDHNDYTVAWVCALGCELDAARALLDEEDHPVKALLGDDNVYFLGCMGQHNVVIVTPGAYGPSSTAQSVTQLVRTFPNIRFGLLVGLGGGAPDPPRNNPNEDIRLGDVVVSEPIDDYGGVLNYDVQKWRNEDFSEIESRLDEPPVVLLKAIERIRLDHRFSMEKMWANIQIACQKFEHLPEPIYRPTPHRDADQLFRPGYRHIEGKTDCRECDVDQTINRFPRNSNRPVVHYGLIASANTPVKSSQIRDRLRNSCGVSCLEVGAGGSLMNFPCLVIRGICDYCDSHKSKQWQPYAAVTAAAYAKDLLRVIGTEQVAVTKLAQAP